MAADLHFLLKSQIFPSFAIVLWYSASTVAGVSATFSKDIVEVLKELPESEDLEDAFEFAES